MKALRRSRAERRRDTEHRLAHDIDVWVASASLDGEPYLVPLSFDWDGEALLVATPADSPTGRNLASTQSVRLGLGHTRDVCMIDGDVEILEIDALPKQRGDRFAEHTLRLQVRYDKLDNQAQCRALSATMGLMPPMRTTL